MSRECISGGSMALYQGRKECNLYGLQITSLLLRSACEIDGDDIDAMLLPT
jgi:hypothetical protein